MREFFTIAIFKIKADIRMNKTTLNSQKEKHFMLSLRRATPRHRRCTAFRTYFYPRPPCGERLTNKRLDERERNFYPRSPCGERLDPEVMADMISAISIHALLAESDLQQFQQRACMHCISIHALLAESDCSKLRRDNRKVKFLSTLSLRRATAQTAAESAAVAAFLSTLSLRRATRYCACPMPWAWHFYPRSPCGERP